MGDITAVTDADLQDPPEELRQIFKECREGGHAVYATWTKCKENIGPDGVINFTYKPLRMFTRS
jgi:hypothetical protein